MSSRLVAAYYRCHAITLCCLKGGMHSILKIRAAGHELKRWETEYNEDRPHRALKGKTPAERVRELVQPCKSVRDLA
jgi:hypothetical protein